jgi:thiamine biosynthesis lipoprotein
MKQEHRGTQSRRKVLLGAIGTIAAGAGMVGGREAFFSIARAHGLVTRTRAGVAFGTTVSLALAGPRVSTLEGALDDGFAAIRAVERASSLYRPDSELSHLNATGRLERPSAHLLVLLRYAQALSADSGGAFDVTVQPLWDLWAGHAARGERPSAADLHETVARVDWRAVRIADASIDFEKPDTAVTLNGINQGYAADVVASVLAAHGIEHAFIDTGEFGARGTHPEGRDWRLGVVDPRDTARLAFTLDPFRRFAATSGDYATAFSADFKDHHIFDPKKGTSPVDWSSITVSAPSGLEADGLSTALFVLDRDAGRRLLASRAGCSARYFAKDGTDAGVIG